jgi:hypothetical protein
MPRRPKPKFYTVDPLLQIEGTHLRQLHEYWRSKGGNRHLPARADIDPVELARHLGHLYMIDVLAAPRCFRYRLVGVHITQAIDADPTGLFLDEAIECEALPDAAETLQWVVEERAPLRLSGRTRLPTQSSIGFEALKLPLASDGINVDVILCSLRFEEAPISLGHRIPSFASATVAGLSG